MTKISFDFWRALINSQRVMEPLAFVMYESLLPGSQLTNRLRDLGYRVKNVTDPAVLVDQVRSELPMVAVLEMPQKRTEVSELIRQLREDPDTRHVPVLAYTGSKDRKIQEAAHAAGATLIVMADGLLSQLPMLLERVLEVE